MCLTCHKLNSEVTEEQLTRALTDPNFDKWNTCSVSHLLISNSGYDGEANKKKAGILLDKYKKHLSSTGSYSKLAQVHMQESAFDIMRLTHGIKSII